MIAPIGLDAEARRFADRVDIGARDVERLQSARQRLAQRMATNLRQRQRQRLDMGVEAFEIVGLGAAEGERAGLVDHRPVHLGQPFERRSILDQHPDAHQFARRDDLRCWHRQPKRARAGDDQHRHRDQQALVPTRADHHPADKRQQGERMNRGGVEPRRAVGDADIARLALRRLAHQACYIGQRGVGANRRHLDLDGRIEVECPGMDAIIGADQLRRAFAGQQRKVEAAGSADNGPIRR